MLDVWRGAMRFDVLLEGYRLIGDYLQQHPVKQICIGIMSCVKAAAPQLLGIIRYLPCPLIPACHAI
jgi:hypothetical protein